MIIAQGIALKKLPRVYVRCLDRGLIFAAILMWGGVAASTVALPMSWQIAIFLVGIAAIGAPHGIFDIDLAIWAAPSHARHVWMCGFFGLYLAMVAIGAVAWLIIPKLALIGFLMVAAFHFGCEGGDTEAGGALRFAPIFARGVSVILGPMIFHAPMTAPIFAGLAMTSPSVAISDIGVASMLLAPIWVAALSLAFWCFARRGAWIEVLELSSLVALFSICPPLFAFTIYFCGVHAVRHTVSMAQAADLHAGFGQTRIKDFVFRPRLAWVLRRMIPFAAVFGLAIAVILLRSQGSLPDVGGVAVLWTFRCLAALTIPHLALTPLLEARCRRRQLQG